MRFKGKAGLLLCSAALGLMAGGQLIRSVGVSKPSAIFYGALFMFAVIIFVIAIVGKSRAD